MYYYHVISDLPKHVGDHIVMDEQNHNGVYRRVHACAEIVEDIYRHPEKYQDKDLSHEVRVALRELALETIRKEKYPQYPSRMACLYVSRKEEEAERWSEYFAHLGRPTYGIAKIKVTGNSFIGDACKCFDGTLSEQENLRMAELYWENGQNEDGHLPIVEILVDGDIEILEILKTTYANA